MNAKISDMLLIGILYNVNKCNIEKAIDLLYILVSRGGCVKNKGRRNHNKINKFYDEEVAIKRKDLRSKFKKWKRKI